MSSAIPSALASGMRSGRGLKYLVKHIGSRWSTSRKLARPSRRQFCKFNN